jgi:hypothetical protein
VKLAWAQPSEYFSNHPKPCQVEEGNAKSSYESFSRSFQLPLIRKPLKLMILPKAAVT